MSSSIDYPSGLSPYNARQNLLYHTYSPLISVHSTHNADEIVQQVLENESLSVLTLLKPYGNNAKYNLPDQSFKTTNTQLITKAYPSFPVRFETSFSDLLSITAASRGGNNSNTNKSIQGRRIPQAFSITSLDILLSHNSLSAEYDDLYLNLFQKVITSNNVVPFETFNHPVSQLFIINMHKDDLDSLRKSIVDFRNHTYPSYFQIDDLLVHVFIFYDSTIANSEQVLELQEQIYQRLSIGSTPIPLQCATPDEVRLEVDTMENSTIDEDLQSLSLNENSNIPNLNRYIQVHKYMDENLRRGLHGFINSSLIPHMESSIRLWDDQILSPRRSITGRFFSVSRKIFNSSDSVANTITASNSAFNQLENAYHKSSPEQKLRKLADWSLMLKDFKYAYSTYEFIKKDYTNDKAWVYVASSQEMCIVSLLLAQTQANNTSGPDKNTIRKIKVDIIEPYLDNFTYTFKSRLNLRSYVVKALLVVIELILCFCLTYDAFWWWGNTLESYLCRCINEIDSHLSSSGYKKRIQVIRAILYERVGYGYGRGILLTSPTIHYLDLSNLNDSTMAYATKVDRSSNPNKLIPCRNGSVAGFTRYRKSALWYVLAMKEWLTLQRGDRIAKIITNTRLQFNINEHTECWYDRDGQPLRLAKTCSKKHLGHKDKSYNI